MRCKNQGPSGGRWNSGGLVGGPASKGLGTRFPQIGPRGVTRRGGGSRPNTGPRGTARACRPTGGRVRVGRRFFPCRARMVRGGRLCFRILPSRTTGREDLREPRVARNGVHRAVRFAYRGQSLNAVEPSGDKRSSNWSKGSRNACSATERGCGLAALGATSPLGDV